MKKDDAVYLHHILAAIERIEAYSEGVSFQEFLQIEILQDGVIRQLEIIGEATRNLSTDLCRRHPEVPWGEIIGLRNRIAHAYYSIDLGVVWDILRVDLPSLKEDVARILEEVKDPGRQAS
ncbi:MAG: DUF86 domain-containing protein [Methanothrix sp.]|nr:DUF86 domain-containing protein [Methanothrix sp.]